jgi:hypothetical protein
VSDEVADIERRVADAVQVEVDEIELIAIDQNLISVKVAMNSPGNGISYGRSEVRAFSEEVLKTLSPPLFRARDECQPIPQHIEFIAHGMSLVRLDTRMVELVSRLSDATDERFRGRGGEEFGQHLARDLPLNGHSVLLNDSDGLGHKDSVVAGR